MSRIHRRRRGAAAAEFVLIFPIMFMLFVGTIEFGNYFSDLSLVMSATQSGARYGARQDRIMTALTRAATGTELAMSEMGYSCSGSGGGCVIRADVINQNGINFIEVTTTISYQWVTQSGSDLFGVIPQPDLFARAVYPHVGDSII